MKARRPGKGIALVRATVAELVDAARVDAAVRVGLAMHVGATAVTEDNVALLEAALVKCEARVRAGKAA